MRVLLPFLTTLALCASEAVDLNQVVFIINSQPNAHHTKIASETKAHLRGALNKEGGSGAEILLTHEDDAVPYHGAWTYYPALAAMAESTKYREKDWFIFLEENSRLDAGLLKSMLSSHRPSDSIFLGHSITDNQNVVIHHYDMPGLKYPLVSAGFVVSRGLVMELESKMGDLKKDGRRFPADFNIDPAYELAKTFKKMRETFDEEAEPPVMDEEPGLELIHEKRLCFQAGAGCVVWPSSPVCEATDEDIEALSEKTFFGVKTCKQFHEKRLPIIQETWAKAVTNIKYFSEEEDSTYGTSTLPGVQNTERGHCGKTLAIIKYFYEEMVVKKDFDWLVITDDDTMLGARKMLEHLKCYNPNDLVSLGQRYGFRVGSGSYGYDYPTGGGGMVFSKAVAKRMLEREDACKCRSADSPDDMHLGACMASLGTPIVHSARFHQARPEDYHPDLLKSQVPVSFHKFWSTEPRQWYQEWFKAEDATLRQRKALREGKAKDEL